MSAPTYVVVALELGMLLAGLALLWRLVLSPAARLRRGESPLRPWNAPLQAFFVFLLCIFLGTLFTAAAGGILARALSLSGDALKIFSGASAQAGMVAGVLAYHFGRERLPVETAAPRVRIWSSGVATFLISLPILTATDLAWQAFLKLAGIEAPRQDLIRMFTEADSVAMLATLTILAVVVAPIAEELVFRAGLFQYFRTRMPHTVAVLAPALFFAVLHISNWRTLEGFASVGPLVALAVVFSIAYERTGRIGTTIVAHALFNLNTVLRIFVGTGVDQ